MHLRRDAEVEMLAETHVGQHADAEAGVPGVSIADDGACGAVVQNLRSHIIEPCVLEVETYADAKVHGA